MCLKEVFLDYMLGKMDVKFRKFEYISKSEFHTMIVMCGVLAASQLSLCVLLLQSFTIFAATNYEVATEIHLSRLICCITFHFAFGSEIGSSLSLMKYSILHAERFDSPLTAFILAFT